MKRIDNLCRFTCCFLWLLSCFRWKSMIKCDHKIQCSMTTLEYGRSWPLRQLWHTWNINLTSSAVCISIVITMIIAIINTDVIERKTELGMWWISLKIVTGWFFFGIKKECTLGVYSHKVTLRVFKMWLEFDLNSNVTGKCVRVWHSLGTGVVGERDKFEIMARYEKIWWDK